jgi:hypothetical protein
MDLTPGEKAVLGQIRVLYAEGAREGLLSALIRQWPPAHYEAYSNSYAGLLAKRFIELKDAQTFRLTEIGQKALGIAPAASPVTPPSRIERRPNRLRPVSAPVVRPSVMSRFVRSLLGRG